MDSIVDILVFIQSPVVTAIAVALFGLSEALAMVPQVKANSVFQLVAQILSKVVKRPPIALLFIVASGMVACAPHAIYIQGGEKASATVEANMTGGRINIVGPFIYCETTVPKTSRTIPSLEGCTGLDTPPPVTVPRP